MITLNFLITSLIVVIIPGTGVIYTVSTGLSSNRRNAIVAALGCTLGIVPHIIAAILGFTAILHISAQVLHIIRIIGIIYLLYLGIGLIRTKETVQITQEKSEKAVTIIGKAVLINLLNPKLTLFFFSFLPQFITPGSDLHMQLTLLSLFFMALTFFVFSLYGLMANGFREFIKKSPKVTRRIHQTFGVILIGFAGKLALED
jgi:threonine/homoserine/homoserine lactone efflux protein